MAARISITFTENEEFWTAQETGIGDKLPERRWWFQSHRLHTRLRLVGFYSASLDEALARIKKGD